MVNCNNKSHTFASSKTSSGNILKEPRSNTVMLLLLLINKFDKCSATYIIK